MRKIGQGVFALVVAGLVVLGGIAAEREGPATPAAASRTWYTADSDTQQGHRSYLVVMNPFSVEAVFDVALFRPRLPPVRSADWIDLTLPPGRSMALSVGSKVLGQEIVGAEIDVSRGRVAAASLAVSPTEGSDPSSALRRPRRPPICRSPRAPDRPTS